MHLHLKTLVKTTSSNHAFGGSFIKKVLFPGEPNKKDTRVDITDVHGDDLTVAQVYRQLLLQRNITCADQYNLVGHDVSKVIIMKDETKITDEENLSFLKKDNVHLSLVPKP